jgi:hypothetical protein
LFKKAASSDAAFFYAVYSSLPPKYPLPEKLSLSDDPALQEDVAARGSYPKYLKSKGAPPSSPMLPLFLIAIDDNYTSFTHESPTRLSTVSEELTEYLKEFA